MLDIEQLELDIRPAESGGEGICFERGGKRSRDHAIISGSNAMTMSRPDRAR